MVFHIIQLKIYFKFAKYFIHLLSYYNMLYYSTIIPLFGAKQELRWLNKNKVENLNSQLTNENGWFVVNTITVPYKKQNKIKSRNVIPLFEDDKNKNIFIKSTKYKTQKPYKNVGNSLVDDLLLIC